MNNDNVKKVRTRFAPSPTGYVHIGNLRTALYAYLYAKSHGGDFCLRIEDTDQKRLVDDATQKVLEVLDWAGIKIDEGVMLGADGKIKESGNNGPYTQSKRLDIYKKYAQQLIDEGKAYYCFCTAERLNEVREDQQKNKQAPMYDGCCREISKEDAQKRIEAGEKYVIRLKVPRGEKIEFTDGVFGKISVFSDTVDDQVLMKTDGFPTYHLAVVVDDHLMEFTHVLRGEEWIPSTPKHVILYNYFGWEAPQFIHLPNIVNENRKKLSKRQGDVSVEDFQKKGYLPEGLVNFLALLGWNPKTEQEIFSLEELGKRFDEKGIHKTGAVFDYKKLDWINSNYIKQKTSGELTELCWPYLENYSKEKSVGISREVSEKIVSIEQERMKKLSDITDNIDFYFSEPVYEKELLRWKKNSDAETIEALNKMKGAIEKVEKFDIMEDIKNVLFQEADGKVGDHLWPLRAALTGAERSPSPFEVAWVIGKEKSLERIEKALEKLK